MNNHELFPVYDIIRTETISIIQQGVSAVETHIHIITASFEIPQPDSSDASPRLSRRIVHEFSPRWDEFESEFRGKAWNVKRVSQR